MKKISPLDSTLDQLYSNHDTKIARLLGDKYNRKDFFKWGEKVEIAHLISGIKHPDGQNVSIFEVRMPSRFLSVKAIKTKTKESFVFSAGSNCDQLIYDIAIAIQKGMLILSD